MGIQFETDYNMETLTAMAKGLRKTVRKKRSRRVHIFAAVVLIIRSLKQQIISTLKPLELALLPIQ